MILEGETLPFLRVFLAPVWGVFLPSGAATRAPSALLIPLPLLSTTSTPALLQFHPALSHFSHSFPFLFLILPHISQIHLSQMWIPWFLRSPSRVKYFDFRCNSLSDVQSLCANDDNSTSLKPPHGPVHSSSLLRRVRISTTVLRAWYSTILHRRPLPDAHNRAVVYYTSLRVVRRTFEDCHSVRSTRVLGDVHLEIWKTHAVPVAKHGEVQKFDSAGPEKRHSIGLWSAFEKSTPEVSTKAFNGRPFFSKPKKALSGLGQTHEAVTFVMVDLSGAFYFREATSCLFSPYRKRLFPPVYEGSRYGKEYAKDPGLEIPTPTTNPPHFNDMDPILHQGFWGFVGPEVVNFVKNWWDGRASIAGIAKTICFDSEESLMVLAAGSIITDDDAIAALEGYVNSLAKNDGVCFKAFWCISFCHPEFGESGRDHPLQCFLESLDPSGNGCTSRQRRLRGGWPEASYAFDRIISLKSFDDYLIFQIPHLYFSFLLYFTFLCNRQSFNT